MDGVACPSPYLIGPEHDGKEIVVTDVAVNDAGAARVSSSPISVTHPMPQALGVPENVSINAMGEAVVVDASKLFVGTSGGQWSAACAADADALQLEINETGRMTLGAGTLIGSAAVSVSYANSGGSTSAMFTVSSGDVEPVEAPKYDGSLGALSIESGELVSIEAGLAFSGAKLSFSASGLPDGVVANSETGRIAGQTAQLGSYSVTVSATNPAGSAKGVFKLEIVEKPQSLPAAPNYNGSLQAQTATLGATFELSAGSAFTGESLSFAAAGLPPDLVIDAGNGGIRGKLSSTGEFAITVTASNPSGEASGTFSLTVAEPLLAAPAYNGGLTDKSYENNIDTQTYDISPYFSNIAAGIWSVSSSPTITSGLSIDQFGVVAMEPLPLPEGVWTVTATFSDGFNPPASGSFKLAIMPAPEQESGDPDSALNYDGMAPKQIGPSDLPYEFSQHISGPGPVTYSASGLPAGVTIGATTGTISDSARFTGMAAATVTASNGAPPDIQVGISFDEKDGSGTDGSGLPKAASHDLITETNSATLDIGVQDPESRVWATVMVGGTEDAEFTTSDGASAATVETKVPVAKRALQLVEITAASGATVPAKWAGDTESVATFRTKGLQPRTGGAIEYRRQAANNANTAAIAVTVPEDGAVLMHGKRYAGITGRGANITPDDSVNSGASIGVRSVWTNTTGAPVDITVTFTIDSSASEKYGLVVVMEAQR
jgi:hypothetical protein